MTDTDALRQRIEAALEAAGAEPLVRTLTDVLLPIAKAERARERAVYEGRRTALATTLQRGPGADWYAIRAAAAEYVRRAEKAEAQVRDYENRLTWETTCGEHARLLDACRAADEGRERADEALGRVWALLPMHPGNDQWTKDIPATALRAALDGDQPAPKPREPFARVVALRSPAGYLFCLNCGTGSDLAPLAGDDLPGGGLCADCAADVFCVADEHTCPEGEPCPVPGHDQPEPEPLHIPEQAVRDLYRALGQLLGETP